MTTTPLWLQALIGFGGALIGALVGGSFVIWAGTIQWRRDRLAAKADRSQSAAQSLLRALASLEGAVVQWTWDHQADSLASGFNAFSITTNAEAPMLTDEQVSTRLHNHVDFVFRFTGIASSARLKPDPLVPALRLHADAVTDALTAHVRGQPLPPYKAPPLEDVQGILDWGTAERARRDQIPPQTV
jgi:hypothetical protein